ncbi:MAG: hypothetical protein ACNA8R_11270 [Nitriliruptoraceae bacterium]
MGLVFVLALEGVTRFERELRVLQLREVVAWPSWVIAGVFLLLGLVLLLIVVAAPRMPWLPTAAAVPLLYAMVATLPGAPMNTLPLGGRWAPAMSLWHSSHTLLTGLLTTTAVWGWWSYRRRAGRR